MAQNSDRPWKGMNRLRKLGTVMVTALGNSRELARQQSATPLVPRAQ